MADDSLAHVVSALDRLANMLTAILAKHLPNFPPTRISSCAVNDPYRFHEDCRNLNGIKARIARLRAFVNRTAKAALGHGKVNGDLASFLSQCEKIKVDLEKAKLPSGLITRWQDVIDCCKTIGEGLNDTYQHRGVRWVDPLTDDHDQSGVIVFDMTNPKRPPWHVLDVGSSDPYLKFAEPPVDTDTASQSSLPLSIGEYTARLEDLKNNCLQLPVDGRLTQRLQDLAEGISMNPTEADPPNSIEEQQTSENGSSIPGIPSYDELRDSLLLLLPSSPTKPRYLVKPRGCELRGAAGGRAIRTASSDSSDYLTLAQIRRQDMGEEEWSSGGEKRFLDSVSSLRTRISSVIQSIEEYRSQARSQLDAQSVVPSSADDTLT